MDYGGLPSFGKSWRPQLGQAGPVSQEWLLAASMLLDPMPVESEDYRFGFFDTWNGDGNLSLV